MHAEIRLEEVYELREFGNRLLRCDSLEEVIDITFEKIEKDLYPQVISIFLFSKDDTLKRIRIKGYDFEGQVIDNDWLSGEEYKPGESFSGKAARPRSSNSSSPYGETYYINNFEDEIENFLYGSAYLEKLGVLKSGVSVPLNGTHRTFGTLETLNKRYSYNSTSVNNNGIYRESEVCWLTVLGAHVSAAISRIRKKQESRIYANISRKLADPDNRKFPQSEVYKSITDQFVGSLTPYKACILREGHGDKLFVIERSCTSDISFNGKGLEPRSIEGYLVGEAYQKKEPIIINDIDKEIKRFHSLDWIHAQKLKSFICFPLAIQGESVGTISLFTGYIHKFTENDLEFLENISYLLAAYIVGIKRASDAKFPIFEWQGKIVENITAVESKILAAVNNPDWDFRTVKGIASETNLDESLVQSVLERYTNRYVRASMVPNSEGNVLYTSFSKPVTHREKMSLLRVFISKTIYNSFANKRGAL
ncbi:MAG: GAF domain-containing protein [Thainema sp.]